MRPTAQKSLAERLNAGYGFFVILGNANNKIPKSFSLLSQSGCSETALCVLVSLCLPTSDKAKLTMANGWLASICFSCFKSRCLLRKLQHVLALFFLEC